MKPHLYEEYWELTLGYTDFYSDNFKNTLSLIVKQIDNLNRRGNYNYQYKDYKELQENIQKKITGVSKSSKSLVSIRKDINTFVKLGFVNCKFSGYHRLTKAFLNAKGTSKKKTVFSEIVYDNSCFSRSFTKESNLHHMKFLINTLIENDKLSRSEIRALMLVEIDKVKKGFLSKADLKLYLKNFQTSQFIKRKYNQVSYLINLLSKLEGIEFVSDYLYFSKDAIQVSKGFDSESSSARDSYKQKLYKRNLILESQNILKKEACFLQKLSYPHLIASHIKPFIDCNDQEQYDPNNGLLLGLTVDKLFDKRFISFEDDGKIYFSSRVTKDVKKYLEKYSLDNQLLTVERKQYLAYHRTLVET